MAANTSDVLILGGGPAGLAMATGLARQTHTAVVFDSCIYRNGRVVHMHNVVAWDHENPEKLRSKAREDLTNRYNTITLERNAEIVNVARNSDGGFRVMDKAGRTWNGRNLVIATGMKDTFPEIEGLEDLWARGVYPCLFCDGFEFLNAPSAGVLATGDWTDVKSAVHYSRMTARVVKTVRIYTNGNEKLGELLLNVLRTDHRFKIENRRILKMTKAGQDVLVCFADGTTTTEAFIAHRPVADLNNKLVYAPMQLDLTPKCRIKIDANYQSNVHGVFAIGDCATNNIGVANAMAMGTLACAEVVAQLQSEFGTGSG